MKQRVVTGIAFALIMTAFLLPGLRWPAVTLALFILVALTCSIELVHAVRNRGIRASIPIVLPGALSFLLVFLMGEPIQAGSLRQLGTIVFSAGAVYALSIISYAVFSVLLPVLRHGPEHFNAGVANSVIMLYVSYPMASAVILLYLVPDGWTWMTMAIVTPWISDTFAFFSGTLLGRHKIVPRLSPKKTWEGFFGGILGTVLAMVLFFQFWFPRMPGSSLAGVNRIVAAILFGTVLSLASQLGDWLASAVKRWCDVKDFGSLLPGHGGMMDRFDSVFFTLPLLLMLLVFYLIQ